MIRKLVVAGIVSAEKSYIDGLQVMKEVSCIWREVEGVGGRGGEEVKQP